MIATPQLSALARNPLRSTLIVAQVTLTSALVIAGAGLAMHIWELGTRFTGLDEPALMLVRSQPYAADVTAGAVPKDLVARDLAALRALPGVLAADWAEHAPYAHQMASLDLQVGPRQSRASVLHGGPALAEALGSPLIDGDWPRAPGEVVLSRDLARDLFGERSAVGQPVTLRSDGREVRVAGVVAWLHVSCWHALPPGRSLVFPEGRPADQRQLYLARFAPGTREAGFEAARTALAGVWPRRVISADAEDLRRAQTESIQFVVARMIVEVAACVLALLALGLAGVSFYLATLRRREIGIRRALGATRADVIWQLLAEVGALAAAGTLLGLPLGILLQRAAEDRPGAASLHPAALALIAAAVICICLAAALVPALRAARVPPHVASS